MYIHTKTDEFFEKFRRGGGSFPIQKFILQIFAIIKTTLVMNFGNNPQYDFPKMRGPLGIFPKIHPFWYGYTLGRVEKRKKRNFHMS